MHSRLPVVGTPGVVAVRVKMVGGVVVCPRASMAVARKRGEAKEEQQGRQ